MVRGGAAFSVAAIAAAIAAENCRNAGNSGAPDPLMVDALIFHFCPQIFLLGTFFKGIFGFSDLKF